MAIDKGNIKTSANYDVKAQKPLDGRAVRPTKADLINRDSWSADGSTVYAYEGMQVYVQDEKKTYYLKDLSKMFATDFSGWELMGTGATPDITVDSVLSEDSTNPVQNQAVAKAVAGKQDILMNGINIKTINGENILGRGNITIEGGGETEPAPEEVYIGSDEPPVGAKVWIDPTGTPSQPSAGVEVIDNLESDSTTAALSANQGRVLKEMIAAGGGAKVYIVPDGVINATENAPYALTNEEMEKFYSYLQSPESIVAVNLRWDSTTTSYAFAHEVLNWGHKLQIFVDVKLYGITGNALRSIEYEHYEITISGNSSQNLFGFTTVLTGEITLA